MYGPQSSQSCKKSTSKILSSSLVEAQNNVHTFHTHVCRFECVGFQFLGICCAYDGFWRRRQGYTCVEECKE